MHRGTATMTPAVSHSSGPDGSNRPRSSVNRLRPAVTRTWRPDAVRTS